jgi:hypothetical protein
MSVTDCPSPVPLSLWWYPGVDYSSKLFLCAETMTGPWTSSSSRYVTIVESVCLRRTLLGDSTEGY